MKICRFYIIIGLILSIAGCSSNQPVYKTTAPENYVTNVNKKFNDVRLMKLQQKLEQDGVEVISIGQDYKLVIPTQSIYYGNSPRVRWGSYGVLNDVANYLRSFNKVNVKVLGYSHSDTEERSKALAVARARKLSKYIWSQSIDARLLSIEGFADMNGKQNNRIEIHFRHVLV